MHTYILQLLSSAFALHRILFYWRSYTRTTVNPFPSFWIVLHSARTATSEPQSCRRFTYLLVLAFGIWHLAFAFGIWHLAFGIWHLAFGIWHLHLAFGIWHLAFAFGIWHLAFAFGIHNLVLALPLVFVVAMSAFGHSLPAARKATAAWLRRGDHRTSLDIRTTRDVHGK